MSQLAYLEQLGVDLYLPRQALPNARPSRYGIKPEAVVSESAVESPRQPLVEKRIRPDIDGLGEGPSKPAPRPEVKPAPAVARAPAVAFNLLVVAVGDAALFVSELRSAPLRPDLEANILQFLGDVGRALGQAGGAGRLTPLYFQWPMGNNPGMDQGADAARGVLSGFLSHQLAEVKPARLVLMGKHAQRYVLTDSDGQPEWLKGSNAAVCSVAGLGQMFKDPALKAELWQALTQH